MKEFKPTYIVEGLLAYSDKKFKINTTNRTHAMGINLWRGRVKMSKPNGGYTVIKSVTN